MTVRAAVCAARLALLLDGAISSRAAAEQTQDPYTLELNLFGGYNRMYLPTPAHRGEVSQRDGGLAIAVGSLLRTKYFLSPFIDVNYHSLMRSTDQVDLGPSLGGPALANNFLSVVGLLGGAALDVWRLRIRAGLGLDFVLVHSKVNGAALTSSEKDMSYFLALGGYLWRSGRFKLGIEARTSVILNANIGFVTLGVTGNADLLRW